jgi:hypothetical protein
MKDETKITLLFSMILLIEILWWMIISDFWWEPVRCSTVEHFDMVKHTIRTLILFIPFEIYLVVSIVYLLKHSQKG